MLRAEKGAYLASDGSPRPLACSWFVKVLSFRSVSLALSGLGKVRFLKLVSILQAKVSLSELQARWSSLFGWQNEFFIGNGSLNIQCFGKSGYLSVAQVWALCHNFFKFAVESCSSKAKLAFEECA